MKDFALEIAKRSLQEEEGFKQYPYCINGVLHIGYGFNLDDVGIFPEEADFILSNRINIAEVELLRNIPIYPMLSDNRRAIMLNLCFNMGISRLMEFRKFLDALSHKDWERASKELMDSEAAKQNPSRMERLAYCLEVDKLL